MLVTIVIPAVKWDPFLSATVESLLHQNLPTGTTLEIAIGLAGEAPASVPNGVKVIPNPSGTIPDALNLAIAAAAGEIIVRVDARCQVAPDHVARLTAKLADPTVGCVGGAQLVLDRGVFGSAYAIAFNSALLGPSIYRYGRTSRDVDTAYLGAWRRADLDRLGGFDPRLRRNQDNELADRIRAGGQRVWFDADTVVGYHNNRGLRGAMAHHRDFGAWRMLQRSQGQQSMSWRQASALGVVGVAGLGLAAAAMQPKGRKPVAALTAMGYLSAAAAARWSAGRLVRARPDLPALPFHPLGSILAPAVAIAIDTAWGIGLLDGCLRPKRFTKDKRMS